MDVVQSFVTVFLFHCLKGIATDSCKSVCLCRGHIVHGASSDSSYCYFPQGRILAEGSRVSAISRKATQYCGAQHDAFTSRVQSFINILWFRKLWYGTLLPEITILLSLMQHFVTIL